MVEIQGSKHKKENNTELIRKIQVSEKAPILICGNDEQGYALTLGKNRLTDWYKTENDVREHMKEDMWGIITSLVAVMITEVEELKKENEARLQK